MEGAKGKVSVGLLIALVIAGTGLYSWWQKNTIPATTKIISPGTMGNVAVASVKTDKVMIYISGGINKPGVYEVQAGLRVLDVVNLAGGLTPNADANRVNMAQVVKDGLHISVPIASSAVNPTGNAGANSEKISINRADKNELDKLPGIGPALAERIIEYRQTNGTFSELEELKKVPGIGDAKYKQLVSKISL